jgi:hypothetical protein
MDAMFPELNMSRMASSSWAARTAPPKFIAVEILFTGVASFVIHTVNGATCVQSAEEVELYISTVPVTPSVVAEPIFELPAITISLAVAPCDEYEVAPFA